MQENAKEGVAVREIPILYLVVPCYNEEEVREKSAQVMGEKIRRLEKEGRIAGNSKIMFVNDGSRDNTLRLLHEIAAQEAAIVLVTENRNKIVADKDAFVH